MPYVDRCKLLKWPRLSDRRNDSPLIECYTLEFSKVASTRVNHPFKYCMSKEQDSIATKLYSFFIRIVSKLNDLSRDIEAESLHYFKNKLHHYLLNKF